MNRRSFLASAAAGAAAVTLAPSRVLGANNRVRIGIIGSGSRGQEDMRSAIALKDVEFVAIADTYSRRRDEAKAIAPGAETYDDPRRLLDRKDIDGVIVATPALPASQVLPRHSRRRQRPLLRKDDDLGYRRSNRLPQSRSLLQPDHPGWPPA